MRVHLPAFTAGELSPKLHKREDVDSFGQGCKKLENYILMPYGGANVRPGLEFISAGSDETNPIRLVAFNYSTTTSYTLEFGHQYLRFFSNGELVLSGGNPLKLTTPYPGTEIYDLQFQAIGDFIYITHQDYKPVRLVRNSDTNWTFNQTFDWTWPALQDINDTGITITPSGTSGSITMTASAALFNSLHVGSYWMIGHYRDNSQIERDLTSSGTSSAVRGSGQWSVTTFGVWGAGTLFLEISRDAGSTYHTLRSWDSQTSGQQNVSAFGDASGNTLYRLRYAGTGTGSARAYLEMSDNFVKGLVQITGFTSSTVVTATVKRGLLKTAATAFWAEGAWSDFRGYPRAVTIHMQRVCYGGTSFQPQTIWSSAIDDFENFQTGVLDTDAVIFSLASTTRQTIQWLASQGHRLLAGTTSEEHVITAAEGEGVFTPSNAPTARRQTAHGSAHLPAVLVNDDIMFVQRQGRKIREFSYTFERDKYVAPDMTLLAEHISKGGIREVAFQEAPDPILWVVNGIGELAGMTYEADYQVRGWHRSVTDGFFESVCVQHRQDFDETWCVVRRTINGTTRRYIERFDPQYRDILDNANKSDWFYVDCGVFYAPASPTTILTGLGHLEGETVVAVVDGNFVPPRVVTGGQITVPIAVQNKASVGLPYIAELRPLGIEVSGRDGSSQGRKFYTSELTVTLYNSLGGEVETAPGEWTVIPTRATDDPMDSSPPVINGAIDVYIAGSYQDSMEIAVRQTQPMPLTILSLTPRIEISGD